MPVRFTSFQMTKVFTSMKINSFFTCIAYMLLVHLIFAGSHTEIEAGLLVRRLLDDAQNYFIGVGHFDEDTIAQTVTPLSWNGFLKMTEKDGWTFDEKKDAFDGYLASLASVDWRSCTSREQNYVAAALTQCDVLGYTNACRHLRGLVANPGGIFREKAICVLIKLGQVNDSSTEFIESVVTNRALFSRRERAVGLMEYAKALRNSSEDNLVTSNAMRMVYRLRHADALSSISCDKTLSDRMVGYEMSSNRLSYALGILQNEGIGALERRHFSSVTNRLLSSGCPLRQLTIWDGYE